MKSLLKLLALFVAVNLPSVAQRATYTLPETGEIITLSFHPVGGQNNSFDTIDVTSIGKHFHLLAKNNVARFPTTAEQQRTDGFWADIPGLKLHPSRFFLVGRYGTGNAVHTLLFLVGPAFASDAYPILILGFSATGEPYKVLERKSFDITSFESRVDGAALIIGKETLSQVIAGDGGNGSKTPYATTYDPFAVFTLKFGEKAIYSLDESRSYNQKHYVWAGAHSREDYSVLYNLPKHRGVVGAPSSHVDVLLKEEPKTK